MTREELCEVLGLAADAPAAEMVQARSRRQVEIAAAVHEEGLPKPVRLKLLQEAAQLDGAAELAAELETISAIEKYLAEIDAEFAKPKPVRGVIRLCLDKLKPLVSKVKTEAARFGFEKRTIEMEERAGLMRDTVETPVLPEETKERIERYFSELAAELAKPDPGRGVVRLCLGKLKPLVEGIKDEAARYGYEKRIAQVEDRLGLRVSAPPFVAVSGRPPPPARQEGEAPPVPKPAPTAARPRKPGPAAGTLLRLLPMAGERAGPAVGPPIHFVARPRFLLGRRRASVDYVTAFLPENEENQRKNERISRINTTLFVKENQIWVQDGELLDNGEAKPSVNGTVIDGRPLVAAEPLALTKERRLTVGLHDYELAVLQLPAAAPAGPLLAGAPGTLSTQPVRSLGGGVAGCVRFLPTVGREVAVVAVWLFTDAALGADPQSAVRLEQSGLPALAARVHFWQGGFWLGVPAEGKSVVTLDEIRMEAGEVVPLQPSHALRVGSFRFDVRVS